MLDNHMFTELVSILGCTPERIVPVSRSWGIGIVRVECDDGRRLAVKQGPGRLPNHLLIEAFMLEELARSAEIPVPAVIHASEKLLVMDWIDNEGSPSTADHERHAGELIAQLHGHSSDRYGYSRDTVIGGITQANPENPSWLAFFRDARLLHMTALAHDNKGIDGDLRTRIERLAERLECYIDEPETPVLLHGDLWGGNILVRGRRIAGFIDPAIYWGHPEIELAFTTLFATFGAPFFDAYARNAYLSPDFFELRRDLYNLYPLLVHATLFGPSYATPIATTLKRLGL